MGSYQNCGHAPSVDGIEIRRSASIMSTVGLELKNLINPDLTWKLVTKGYRSASRRTRKPGARNFNVEMKQLNEGTRKVDDTMVSDSEKGVAVPGDTDKIERVPIKKRRFVFQSPPPPPCSKMLEPNANGKRRRNGRNGCNLRQKTAEIIHDNKFDYSEDFSGIEILATVACNNSMFNNDEGDEVRSVMEESMQEGVGSSSPAVPFEETASSPQNLVYEDTAEASFFQNSTLTGQQKSPKIEDSKTEGSASSQADKLDLDLNVAWEQPCDNSCVDSEANIQHCEIQIGLEDIGKTRVEPKSEACTSLDGKHDEVLALPTIEAQEFTICDVSGTRVSSQDSDRDAFCEHSACPEVSEGYRDPLLSGPTMQQSAEVCCSDVKESGMIETGNVSSPSPEELERVTCEIDQTMLNEEGEERERKHIQDVFSLDDGQSAAPVLLGVEPGNQMAESGGNCCLPNTGDISSACVFAVGDQPVVTLDATGQANDPSVANATELDSPPRVGSEELMQKSSVDSSVTSREACMVCANGPTSDVVKVTTKDPPDDSFESDVYQADMAQIVCSKKNVELEAGYDSQFEDGELRESDSCYNWDENGEDGEVEHVDYGCEYKEESLCGLGNEKEKMEGGSSPPYDNVNTKSVCCGAGDDMRNESVSPKKRATHVTNDKDFPSGVFGSRECNSELSHIEGSYAIHQKDAILRSRDATLKKFMGRDGTSSHMCGRSPGDHHFVNTSPSYWDLERRCSPNYRGSCTSGTPRPKSVVASRGRIITSDHSYFEAAGIDNCARRQFINSASNGVHERIIGRRSPTNRDDAYAMHTGVVPVRDGSPIRSRFRRFPVGAARGIREGYHRPMPEDNIEYSKHFVQRLARRERSISPFRRGRPCYTLAYKKSWSRSRSRSPTAYLRSRERNGGSRHRSRSPDFRSDARMDRMRLSSQKRFAAEFDGGFIPQARSRFSAQHNSRWFDDRNGVLDSSRGRKSVNMLSQRQRFNSVHSNRRLDPHDQFAPMVQSRKFPDTGTTGRGGEYEVSDDDRRKRGNRYEMVHRMRRYDTDALGHQLRHNGEDSFVANDSHKYDDCSRLADRRPRDALRRVSEE